MGNNMLEEITRQQFFSDAFGKINQQVTGTLHFRGLSAKDRGNVMELPIVSIKGCHYEIGFHLDCDEIALHFQGTPVNNSSRSEGFRPYLSQLEARIGHSLILGSHEGKGRKRLWIKLPKNSLTPDLLEQYSTLTAEFIILTLPILQAIMQREKS
jgi:hypothetical protein